MIIGSGMLAMAFRLHYYRSTNVIIYAAGVSNSSCIDSREYERERQRLLDALDKHHAAEAFVYFGTCSVFDPVTRSSPYVLHKLSMETIVLQHPNYVIARLPQVAGKTFNAHTLLNFLHSNILHSRRFRLYKNAMRNIIDVDDVVAIIKKLLDDPAARAIRLNIANPRSCKVAQLVSIMEEVTGKMATTELVELGENYEIDTVTTSMIANQIGLSFGDNYIHEVIKKYYSVTPSQ